MDHGSFADNRNPRTDNRHQTSTDMKKRSLPITILLLASGTCLGQSTSPQVLSTAGGEGTSGTSRMSWTIGEPVIETVTAGGHTLTQGFQQPWVDIVTDVTMGTETGSGIIVFPNPTRHIVHVVYDEAPLRDRYELRNALGQLLMQDRVQGSTTDLDMTKLSSGSYYLRLLDDQNSTKKTFTINVTR